MPRKLEIERRKRLYAAQDVEALLLAKGIDYSRPYASALLGGASDDDGAAAPQLPLVVFDDDDFEVHDPDGWLAMGLRARADNVSDRPRLGWFFVARDLAEAIVAANAAAAARISQRRR